MAGVVSLDSSISDSVRDGDNWTAGWTDRAGMDGMDLWSVESETWNSFLSSKTLSGVVYIQSPRALFLFLHRSYETSSGL